MKTFQEKRREKRLKYHWPIWYGDDFQGVLNQGQMIDVSSGGAAFTCYSDNCPTVGQEITARFSIPKYEDEESFDLENYIRHANICRVQELSPFIRKVAVQFHEELPFKPGEQEANREQLEAALH